ncbi:MAG: hypothetical protein F6K11_18115 [Leptolyngbya sp. SIO3F4]|nr:hypothetical protein [Leptolyngbya sp. SIO3F4]
MALPESISSVDKGRVFLAPVTVSGATLPTAYTFASGGAVAAGAGTISLDIATVDGAAASSETVELETGQPILFPSTNAVSVDGTSAIGDFKLDVDDGSNALPTNLIAVGDYIKFAGDTQLYLVVERTTGAAEYSIRVNPALVATPADNAVVTVYNRVKLALAGATQFVDVNTTPASVAVTGVTYPMADGAESLTTYAYKQLLGITEITPSPGIESTEVSNMLFTAELTADNTFSIGITGQKVLGDSARREVLMPRAFNKVTNKAMYALYESLDGDLIEGPANLTEGDVTSAKGDVEEYSFTLGITLGDNFNAVIR